MKAIKLNNGFLIKLDRNDMIISSLKNFLDTQNIKTASIQGIGAVQKIEIGRYEVANKKFITKKFYGEFEVVSLIGNITLSPDDNINIHLHIAFADKDYHLFGGHLVEATVSATFEIFVTPYNQTVKRKFDNDTGLNLIE